jgi:glyoxylase-like metal-dependent hydrolase (beta-lactamase superfamily II)
MMLKTSIFTFVAAITPVIAAAGCEGDQGPAGPQGPPGGLDPNSPPIDKAFYALGGRDAVADLQGFRITATGERSISFEGYAPEDDSVPVSTYSADIAFDAAGDRLRIAYKRNAFFFGAMPEYRVLINKDVGVIDGGESVFGGTGGPMTSDRWAATLRQHRLLNPHLILRDVASGKLTATDKGIALRDGEARHRIDINDGARPISLFVDRSTGELTEAATFENDYVTGDVALEAHYVGWKTWDASNVLFPTEVLLALGNQQAHVERRSAITVNGALEASLFAFPAGAAPTYVAADAARGAKNSQFHEGFAGLGVPLDGLQTLVQAQSVGNGVTHLRGGSHNSLVIEQANGVVVVEAPLYEARAKAIYSWITTNIPGKQVTHLVLSHHHRDHAAAARTFVARGAKIVVGALAQPHYASSFRAARTIDPDELATTPRAAQFEIVPIGGEITIPDATRPVRVIHVPSTHASDMVIAYAPNQQVLFVSDIYSPGLPGGNPAGAKEVRDVVVAKSLALGTIAGGHGTTGTRAELDTAAGN